MSVSRPRVLVALGAVFLGLTALSGAVAQTAVAAETPITIWVDAARSATVASYMSKGYLGHPVNVVTKETTAIKAELASVPIDQAPDIIWAENAWTGEFASASLVAPLTMPAAKRALFPSNVMDGFRFGFADYGLPVQFQTWALVSNADLITKPPKNFDALAKKALELKASGKVDVPLAVGQGAKGNAYFTYPLFSGLGGYIFGKNAGGSLDPYNLGVSNPVFRKNARIIDDWNSTGLIDSSVDVAAAEAAFKSGRAPFWITGPWSASTLQSLSFKYRISPIPRIVKGLTPAPLLQITGFMVTTYATTHGLADVSSALVVKKFTNENFQASIAAISLRAPANTKSIFSASTAGRLAQAFGTAGLDGVAMPNITQATVTWAPLGTAWSGSTSGATATPAKQAFVVAQDTIKGAIG